MPNSLNSSLSKMIKVAKPEAVVILVINVAFPILEITRCKESAWFPCFLTSCWYLLIKKIQLGIPMTIINGGIKAVRMVISNWNNPKIPKAHITPIITTHMEIRVARKLLKKKKKIIEVTRRAAPTKQPNFIYNGLGIPCSNIGHTGNSNIEVGFFFKVLDQIGQIV